MQEAYTLDYANPMERMAYKHQSERETRPWHGRNEW